MASRRRSSEDLLQGADRAFVAELLESLPQLSEVVLREVMTPRYEVLSLEAPVKVAEVLRLVKETGHTRFPVYENTLDQLVGVLFLKDLFRMPDLFDGRQFRADAEVKRLRQPLLIPESRHLFEALADLRHHRSGFAVVVDEHGGVEGVITAKDLLEKIVGDLPDEFDTKTGSEFQRVDSNRWLIDGAVAVDSVTDVVGLDLPEGDYVTLGGFLFDSFGRIPTEGDVIEIDGWEFRVTEMDKRRIATVLVRRPSSTLSGSHGK